MFDPPDRYSLKKAIFKRARGLLRNRHRKLLKEFFVVVPLLKEGGGGLKDWCLLMNI